MKFRKLRIAWSVGWGIACVLLVVLWVRSYIQSKGAVIGDRVTHIDSNRRMVSVWSRNGVVTFSVANQGTGYRNGWEILFVQDSYLGFGSVSNGLTYSLQLPHYFPVVLFGIIAASPWLPLIRWRFSLRTLLIATTIIAVVLGLIVRLNHH